MGANAGGYAQLAGVVGKGVSAYGGSKAQQAALDAQSTVQKQNAQIGEWQAEDALTRGATQAQAVMQRGAQLKGTQTARMAANGIALDGGSAQDVLASTDSTTARDVATVEDNMSKEAWAYRVQATNNTNNAALLDGRSKAINPFLSGVGAVTNDKSFGTLLTKGGSVANRWYGYVTGDAGRAAGGDGTWST